MSNTQNSRTLLRIAVDARPLRHTHTGIGKYTQKILAHLAVEPGLQLFLYGAPTVGVGVPDFAEVHHRRLSHGAWLSTVEAMSRLGRLARHDGVDLFWSPRHHLPMGLGALPAVVTIHDVVWRKAPRTLTLASRWLERMRMPPAISRAERIVVPSEQTRDEVIEAYPNVSEKVRVTWLGGDLVPPVGARVTSPYFVFVGGDHPRKNLTSALAAFTQVEGQIPHQMHIVGAIPPGSDPSLDAQITALGSRVCLRGRLSEAEMAALYRDCEFVLAPSLHEGFGLVVAEAAQFAKPAIISSGGSLAEVAGAGGLIIEPMDIDGMARQLVRIAQDDGLRTELGDIMALRAKKMRWEHTARQTLAVFRELM